MTSTSQTSPRLLGRGEIQDIGVCVPGGVSAWKWHKATLESEFLQQVRSARIVKTLSLIQQTAYDPIRVVSQITLDQERWVLVRSVPSNENKYGEKWIENLIRDLR